MILANFTPRIKATTLRHSNWKAKQVADEPMLHSADPRFAERWGGGITAEVLHQIACYAPEALKPPEGKHVVIDTRVAMLMPGMQSAIPGWHCDAVERDENGQPDITKAEDVDSQHWVFSYTVAQGDNKPVRPAHDALMEWVCQETEADIDTKKPIWAQVHTHVGKERPATMYCPDSVLFQFNQRTIHRATPARGRIWRYWFRLSHYPRPPKNEKRRNCNVYATEGGGW